ncbi:VPLPA-CTERM sorting domain-containing protein [Methylomonas fluvii]|uniref:VPLPA-CTERM sorting domain-containing protein n=1 Tax=Methylomonas fluvii TaxID=1854564 RepID=A0ABR9DAL1_9GAMM|nr:VPLPA-CTERM sorting domain-containing protein [Methylomonas fluvii]MBD9359816.1 VPLPA-CTERM sorting domain-containing protein [Methylomonas fluvii]
MFNRIFKSMLAVFLASASLEAGAAIFTSQVFLKAQESDGELFRFTVENAPFAAMVDGTLLIRARGDYSENSSENIEVTVDEAPLGLVSPSDGGNIITSYHEDHVEWEQVLVLNAADLVNWTSDHKIVIGLNLSSDVEYNLAAGSSTLVDADKRLRFVEATLVYETSAVPLPAAVWVFLSGLIGMVGYGRSRKTM